MTIDERMMLDHRSYTDRSAGFTEEFLQPTLGSGRSIAVLARPTGEQRDLGFVLCHSFAMEQMHLSRTETRVARALAASGSPTIRFQGQGYGDSQGDIRDISLSSHLQDAREALDLLRSCTGVSMTGTIGARFGGAVAALVADERHLPMLVAIDPVVDGAQFMRDFIRTEVFSSLTGEVDDDFFPGRPEEDRPSTDTGTEPGRLPGMPAVAVQADRLRTDLAERGWTDIKGFPLTRRAHEQLSAVRLTADLSGFRGASLLVAISRRGKPSAAIEHLAAHLEGLGGRCTVKAIAERQAASFGQYHYTAVGGDRTSGKVDTLFDLGTSIVRVVDEWVGEEMPRASGAAAAERETEAS